MASADGVVKAREFLFACEETAMAALPAGEVRPERKVMWTILQLHYGNPAVHFELQPQVSRGQVELGLHFEGAAEANDAWAAWIGSHAADLLGALGPAWELEVWTAAWRRLHRVYLFERLTASLAREVGEEFGRALTLLGPLIRESPLGGLTPAAPPPGRKGHAAANRYRRKRAAR